MSLQSANFALIDFNLISNREYIIDNSNMDIVYIYTKTYFYTPLYTFMYLYTPLYANTTKTKI